MRKLVILTSIALLLLLLRTYKTYCQQFEDKLDELSEYIENARQDWNIPGMAVVIVKNDSIIFNKGFGLTSVDNGNAIDGNTIFAIASLTKTFTASAVATLVDSHKIDWDNKVIEYLPYFQLYDPYVTYSMTIRDLLCHRCGLETFSGDLLWFETNYNSEEVIRRARFLKPKYGFRAHYGYSNIMFSAAGEITTKVCNEKWSDYVKHTFLEPLGMKRTSFSVSQLKDMENVAMPHIKFDNEMVTYPYMKWDNITPAGGINSTTNDLAQWLICNMNNGIYKGKQIISDNSFYELTSAQTVMPIFKGSKNLWPGIHFKAYGLGWELFDFNGHKIMAHSGGSVGMTSRIVIMPDEKFGFAILTNSINYLFMALSYHILELYTGEPTKNWSEVFQYINKLNIEHREKENEKIEANRNSNAKPSCAIEDFAGVYESKLYGNAKVELSEGKLLLKLLPAPKLIGELTHWHYNTFKIKLRNSPFLPEGFVSFKLDKDGRPEEMQIDIPNPDFDFTELDFVKPK